MGRKRAAAVSDNDDRFAIPVNPPEDVPGPSHSSAEYRAPIAENVQDKPENKKMRSETDLHSGVSHDVPEPGTESLKPVDPVDVPLIQDVMKELKQDANMLNVNWTQVFRDSEHYEMFCPTRLDRILQDAKALEQNLIQQKDALRNRLGMLSQALKL